VGGREEISVSARDAFVERTGDVAVVERRGCGSGYWLRRDKRRRAGLRCIVDGERYGGGWCLWRHTAVGEGKRR
jgi:hypothetical protein